MRILRYILTIWLAVGVLPPATQAQERLSTEESGGMLVDFLQNQLSGENRDIRVEGLTGAFSSKAQLDRLTIADTQGVWLVIEDATLDWTRSALLRGAFTVNELSARRIAILRAPLPTPADPALPAPEATPFRLPELPVSILLKDLKIDQIELGAALAGADAALSLKGRIELADGALDVDLLADRLDRPKDRLKLLAQYDNQTEQITLDLALTEGAEGLLGTALDVPGRPALDLTLAGQGPVSEFTTQLRFATNGQDRLTGDLHLTRSATADGAAVPGLTFRADLNGNIDPLLPVEYHPFFGPDLRLRVKGETYENNSIALHSLALSSRALRLAGSLSAANGELKTANLRASIVPPAGQAQVILPVPGGETLVSRLNLTAQKSAGADWAVAADMQEFSRPDVHIANATVRGTGTLQHHPFQLDADVHLMAAGLALADPGLAEAVGDHLAAQTTLRFTQSKARASQLSLIGDTYALRGDLGFSGLQDGLAIQVDLIGDVADLSRFQTLAGLPLNGGALGHLRGNVVPLSGGFNIELTADGRDLEIGSAQIDPLIAGASSVQIKATRDADGLLLDLFDLKTTALTAQASGTLDSAAGGLTLKAALDDLGRLVPQARGPVELTADVTRAGAALSGAARLTAPLATTATLEGTLAQNGTADLKFSGTLGRLEDLVAELPGALRATGTAKRTDGQWQITSRATGPGDMAATISGNWDEARGHAALTSTGSVRLGVANALLAPNLVSGKAAFDLALTGPPVLRSLSGKIRTQDARLVLPGARQQLNGINADITLSGERLNLQVNASPRDGGQIQITGPVALAPPFEGALAIALNDLILRDNLSYETTLSGALNLSGALAQTPLLSGQIDVQETVFNLASAGGAVSAAPIPEIQHIGEPGAVRKTRDRAGLLHTGGGAAAPLALDLLIRAPNRIFARGRGLRAELGGEIQVRGTSAAPEPAGQIGLLRGTFDILGRRLTLDDGQITLLGSLVPYLSFTASTTTDQGSATLTLEGPANAPTLEVTADPNRPSEEALALLLFGDNVQDLSPLALARLAASAATLSGRGGGVDKALREGTGAETVDLGVDSLGAGQLGLGGYVSQNVYTDLNVNSRGDSEVSINLDLSPSVTVTGTADSAGETGVGIFFKRDY